MGSSDIRFYISVFARRIPQFFLIAVIVTGLGVAVLYFLPERYQASAKILVETPQISAKLAPSTVPNNGAEQLDVYRQEITTREHLLALSKKFNVLGPARRTLSDADIVRIMRSRTHFELASDASSAPSATVFDVSFEDPDPKVAAAVVNEYVSLILQKNEISRVKRASETLQFFSAEVSRLGGELKSMDSKILEFKNGHQDALPDSLSFRRSEQSSAQQRLQMLEWEEAGLRNRRNSLIEMYHSVDDVAGVVALTPEQQTLQDLRKSLADQLVLYSDKSPNIIALRARIDALQASIRKSATPHDAEASTKVLKGGPSQLDLQLSDIDQRLNFITKEKASIENSLSKLATSISATPANETALNAMMRARENVQAQYTTAVDRYAAASTGKEIEVDSKGERFSVVEPAIAPDRPSWPDRKKFGVLVAVAGIAAGLAFVVLMEMMNTTVRRPAELVSALQVRPIATIPSIRIRRRGFRPAYVLVVLSLVELSQFLFIGSAAKP